MRNLLLILFSLIIVSNIFGQNDSCLFTPTINEGDISTTNDGSFQLTTQEFDSYQWFSDFGSTVFETVGTSSTLEVENLSSGIHHYYVLATLDSCTVSSDTISVAVFYNDCGMGISNFIYINAQNNMGDIEMCQGDSLNVSVSYPFDLDWYLFDTDSTFLISENSFANIAMNSPGAYGLYYVVNCEDSVFVYSDTTNVNVYSPWQPTSEFELFLEGDMLYLDDYIFLNYTWFLDGEIIEGENTSSLIMTETGEYSVQLEGLCANFDFSYFYNSGTEECDFSPSIIEGNVDIFEGNDLLLTTQTYDAYEWYIGEDSTNLILTDSSEYFLWEELPIGQYYVYLNALLDDCSTASDTIQINVFENDCGLGVAESVFVNSINNPSVVDLCQGDSLNVFADYPGNYLWYFSSENDSIQMISNNSNFDLIMDNAGLYELFFEYVCTDQTSFISNPISIAVSSDAVFVDQYVIVQEGNDLEVNDVFGMEYTWFFEGIEIENSDSSTITISETGMYSVEISAICGSITLDYFYSNTSVNEFNDVFEIFPNPVVDEIQFSSSIIGKEVLVINVQGQIVYRAFINDSTESIPVAFLERGIYMLQIADENDVRNIRFVKL